MCNPWKNESLSMSGYDDMFGDIAVNKANKERLEKDLSSGQKSLFFDYDARGNENKEGMKKAAVEKLDKQEAEKEAKKRAAENKYFEDKRVKPSPLVVEAELAKMKEILNKPKGSSGGGGGGIPSDKMDKMKKMNYKAGGKVSSASKRADGCAIRGKTRA
jgi:hypothetical protein